MRRDIHSLTKTMDLQTTIHDTIRAYPDGPQYDDLTELEQRRLVSAYIVENADVVADVLADIPPQTLARHLSEIALTGECDALSLAHGIGQAVYPNKTLASLVQGELDHHYRVSLRYPSGDAA